MYDEAAGTAMERMSSKGKDGRRLAPNRPNRSDLPLKPQAQSRAVGPAMIYLWLAARTTLITHLSRKA